MRFEPLGMEHHREIDACLGGLDEFISDFTFSILFLYREMYSYQVAYDEGPVFVRGTNPVGQRFLTPLVDLRRLGPEYVAQAMRGCDFLYPCAEAWTTIFDERFEVSCQGSEMDYIYRTERLASFKGGQYNRRRNRLKQFTAAYSPSFAELNPGGTEAAFAILNKWQADSGMGERETDFRQCAAALGHFAELPLSGAIYHAGGKPAGFLIGERLNRRVYLIHFLKGLPGFQGLSEFMFNSFAQTIPDCEFINMEEDMGKANLRRTKKSYHPEFLVKKCRVYLSR